MLQRLGERPEPVVKGGELLGKSLSIHVLPLPRRRRRTPAALMQAHTSTWVLKRQLGQHCSISAYAFLPTSIVPLREVHTQGALPRVCGLLCSLRKKRLEGCSSPGVCHMLLTL